MGKAKKDSVLLEGMLGSYRNARNAGDQEDEAKWANNIGHMYKERGEYKLALEWFLKDYTISMKIHASDPVKLMPTCQSIGEAHLRLLDFEKALQWQRKHFHLAEEAADEPEQQRASTQLGRTYLEIFETKSTISAVQDASRYLRISLSLAQNLKACPPPKELSPSGFVKELVDAYNNLGLLRVAVDDFTAAEKYYNQGLKICDEEEVNENDDARSRLHHNLGQLYCELRQWDKAREHTDMDIAICQRIPHAQGEAKGLVNQGILHLKALEFEKARMSFKRALVIAQSLQDETQLCEDIIANLEVLSEAEDKSKQIGVLLQQQKKLRRGVESAPNVLSSRTIIKQEMKLLFDILSEAYAIKSWDVHLGMSKRLKTLAERLGDHEKLGDALDLIGISYYNLRIFSKAIKWHWKEWDVCHRINHLEGQIVAKINLGNCFDSTGDWEGALEAYLDAYKAASSKSTSAMRSQKINALENMHYCYSVRLEQFEDARRVELELQQLKNLGNNPTGIADPEDERCSETDGEGSEDDTNKPAAPNAENGCSYGSRKALLAKDKTVVSLDESEDGKISQTDCDLFWEEFDMSEALDAEKKVDTQESLSVEKEPDLEDITDDHAPLSSLFNGRKMLPLNDICSNSLRREKKEPQKQKVSTKDAGVAPKPSKEASKLTPVKALSRKQQSSRRKMLQTVLSDDEENLIPPKSAKAPCPPSIPDGGGSGYVEDSDNDSDLMEVLASTKKRSRLSIRHYPAKRVSTTSSDTDVSLIPNRRSEQTETSSLNTSPSPKEGSSLPPLVDLVSSSRLPEISMVDLTPLSEHATRVESSHVRAGEESTPSYVQCAIPSSNQGFDLDVNEQSISDRRAERSSHAVPEPSSSEACKGSECLPCGSSCHVNEAKSQHYDEIASAFHDGEKMDFSGAEFADIPVLLRYAEECSISGVLPNAMLINKLQSLKSSEDEVLASECNLTDKCARPFISALQENKTLTVLDLSHNQLGNAAVNDIQQLIKLTNQTDLGLTLDLHSNKLGAGALTQICRCPVALSRLEVLNLSENRLTDAASRHLSLILEGSPALATLSLESCGLTTRTILKLISALDSNSTLAKLCIGKNSPIDGYVLQDLLQKLSTLHSFAELDMKGLELDEVAVSGVCTLLQNSRSISILNLEATDIRNDGALLISESLKTATTRLAKLNLSGCGFHSDAAVKLCTQLMSVHSLSSLDLSCNDLGHQMADNMEDSPAFNQGCPTAESSIVACTGLGQSYMSPETHAYSSFNIADFLVGSNCSPGLQVNILPLAEDSTKFMSHPNKEEGFSLAGAFISELPSVVKCDERLTTCVPMHTSLLDGPSGTSSGQGDENIIPPFISEGEAEQRSKMTLLEDLCKTLVPLSYSNPSRITVDLPVSRAEVSWKPMSQEVQTHDSLRISSEMDMLESASRPFDHLNQAHATLYSHAEAHCKGFCGQPPSKPVPEAFINHVEGAGFAAHSDFTSDAFCEELALFTRSAKGLRRLDLSQNNLTAGDVEQLFRAWTSSARGKSIHERHFDGGIVHFFVQEQPCQCANPPCCSAWSAA
ncbi:hypothetical protein AXG93_2891s1190 [Marchantia polymorpha subsp. ruderalis]|uniref:Protein TONSOKU n=1 Tax=Marchantia polymorpha subsp. ruderalis TaxID=1480154 RepID=A0A176WNQ0_MARPO|nr:hypothetical protein AXG93_2891s1190 [Marchantia polymorpha subsp. ruderalis]